MSLYEKLISGDEALSLIGLGYVGMPIAVAFSKKVKVVGFDLNAKKIELYKNGKISSQTALEFSENPEQIRRRIDNH